MAKRARKPPPSVGLDKFIVRFPPGLRDKLHALAKASGRSANAELVDRLEKSIADSADQKNLQDTVAELLERVERLERESHDHGDPNPER